MQRDRDWKSPLQGIQKTWMSSPLILPHGAYAGHQVRVFKLTCDKLSTDRESKEGQFPMDFCLLLKHQGVSNVQERLGLYYIALKAITDSSSSTYPSILSKLFATQSSESIKYRFKNSWCCNPTCMTESCISLEGQATHLCQKHPFASLPT